MKRHPGLLMAALAMGLSVASTRRLEDEEDARLDAGTFGDTFSSGDAKFRLGYKRPEPEPKVHQHSREITRRLRQKAAREAKRGVK